MKLMKQLAVIMTISFLAELMEILIPLPVAASVYGLLLMLIGLVTKVIPLEKVEDGADFLIEIMPILFVPPTVGLIANVEALRQMLPAGGIPGFPAWDFNSTNRNIPFHYMLKGGFFTLRIYPSN